MCQDTPEEQSFFRDLQNRFTTSFNSAIQDYNALRPHIDQLIQQNSAYRGAMIEGATSMITNRINGAYALYRSPQAFYNAGLSGFKWAYYFARNNDLNSDVRHAGMAALYSHMWPLSLRGVATVAVTGVDMSRGGVQELEEHVRTRYEQQRNALIFSGGLSMGLTQVFKQAGVFKGQGDPVGNGLHSSNLIRRPLAPGFKGTHIQDANHPTAMHKRNSHHRLVFR